MLLQKHDRTETNKACQSIKEVGLFIKLIDVEQKNVIGLLKETSLVLSSCDPKSQGNDRQVVVHHHFHTFSVELTNLNFILNNNKYKLDLV